MFQIPRPFTSCHACPALRLLTLNYSPFGMLAGVNSPPARPQRHMDELVTGLSQKSNMPFLQIVRNLSCCILCTSCRPGRKHNFPADSKASGLMLRSISSRDRSSLCSSEVEIVLSPRIARFLFASAFHLQFYRSRVDGELDLFDQTTEKVCRKLDASSPSAPVLLRIKLRLSQTLDQQQIGRASCRERV